MWFPVQGETPNSATLCHVRFRRQHMFMVGIARGEMLLGSLQNTEKDKTIAKNSFYLGRPSRFKQERWSYHTSTYWVNDCTSILLSLQYSN